MMISRLTSHRADGRKRFLLTLFIWLYMLSADKRCKHANKIDVAGRSSSRFAHPKPVSRSRTGKVGNPGRASANPRPITFSALPKYPCSSVGFASTCAKETSAISIGELVAKRPAMRVRDASLKPKATHASSCMRDSFKTEEP